MGPQFLGKQVGLIREGLLYMYLLPRSLSSTEGVPSREFPSRQGVLYMMCHERECQGCYLIHIH